MAQTKVKLRDYLLSQKIAESAERADALVMAGHIFIDDAPAKTSGQLITTHQSVTVRGVKEYVGRGALKLEHALKEFGVSADGRVCADVGASTGGFTQVLLKHGASKVYAIDVAYGEIAWVLRNDPRVILLERTNARFLDALPEAVSLVTVDVSFISLKLILPQVKRWFSLDSTLRDLIVLVKPQFELEQEKVPDGGIVRDPASHRLAIEKTIRYAREAQLGTLGMTASPIEGSEGNREFLLWMKPDVPEAPNLGQLMVAIAS